MRGILAATACIGLAGCVTTQELPLAPNAVRLDTEARGLLFTGQAVPQTMRRAAQATLDRGYTHFKLEGASLGQGREFGGVTVSRVGNTFLASSNNVPTARAGVTVIMFRATEAGAQGAFDARQVLRQYSQ